MTTSIYSQETVELITTCFEKTITTLQPIIQRAMYFGLVSDEEKLQIVALAAEARQVLSVVLIESAMGRDE